MPEQIGVTYLPVRGGASHMALFYDKGDGSKPRVIEFGPAIPFNWSLPQLGWLASDTLPGQPEIEGRVAGLNSPHGALEGKERNWRFVPDDEGPADSPLDREILATGDDLSSKWAIIQATKNRTNANNFAYLPLKQNS